MKFESRQDEQGFQMSLGRYIDIEGCVTPKIFQSPPSPTPLPRKSILYEGDAAVALL